MKSVHYNLIEKQCVCGRITASFETTIGDEHSETVVRVAEESCITCSGTIAEQNRRKRNGKRICKSEQIISRRDLGNMRAAVSNPTNDSRMVLVQV